MPRQPDPSQRWKLKLAVSAALSLLVFALAVFLVLRKGAEAPPSEPPDAPSLVAGVAPLVPAPAEKSASRTDAKSKAATKEAVEAAAEPAMELPPSLLHGRVTGEGAGVEGASVNLFGTKRIEALIDRIEGLAPQSGEFPDVQALITTVRDELERFRSSATTTKTVKDGVYDVRAVEPGSYFVLVLADGWLFHYGDVVSLEVGRIETLDVALDRGATISGRVVTGAGAGISGALVAAEFRPAGMAGIGLVIRRLLRYVNGEFLKGPFETRTNADGAFTFDSLPPGVYDIAASKVPGVEARLPQVETGATEAILYLGDPATLRGAFTDSTGAPAAGVPFLLERLDDVVQLQIPIGGMDKVANSVNRLIGEGPRKSASGAKGEIGLAPLAPGKYRIVVEHRGFMPFERELELDWGQKLDLGTLRLDRGAGIVGLVRAQGGGAIDGAKVLATPAKSNFMNMGGQLNDVISGRASGTVDASGQFRLAGLAKGQYKLVATAPGYASAMLPRVETDSDPVSFDLKPGTRVTGHVFAAEDSKPLENAKVQAGESRTRADADGRFTLDGVTPKALDGMVFFGMQGAGMDMKESAEPKTTVKVSASAPGFIAAESTIDLAAATSDVEILLEKAPEVKGVVLDPDGKPAPGCLVRLTPAMPDDMPFDFFDSSMIFVGATVSGVDGKFRFASIKGAEDKSRYRVIADHVLYSRGASDPFDLKSAASKGARNDTSKRAPEDDTSELQISLLRSVKVKGVVTDGTKPVPGATVRLAKAQKKNGPAEQFGMFMNMLGLPKGGDLAYTNRDGRFEYARLAPGDYVIGAELAGFTDSPPQSLTLAAGDEREVTLVVDPGGEISGTVSDSGGTALSNARVRLFREPAPKDSGGKKQEKEMLEAQKLFGGSYKSARTAEDGSFRFQGLPGGTYSLAAELAGYVRREVAGIAPGADPQRIELDPAASLAGVVVDSGSGQPITHFSVRISKVVSGPADGDAPFSPGEREYSDVDGRFVREDLEGGQQFVRVSGMGYAPAQEEVFLTTGGRVEKRFALVQAGRIRGVILDAVTQRPVGGARIGLSKVPRDAAAPREEAAPTGADEANARRKKRIERIKSERDDRSGAASTDLDNEDQQALGQHFAEQWSSESTTISGEDGRFVLEGVPPGPQRVFVTHEVFISATRDGVEVGPGEELEANFTLRAGLSVSGKLREASGATTTGRFVFARGTSEENGHIQKSAFSSPTGEFRLGGLEKGVYRLVVTPAKGKRARVEPAVIDIEQNQSGIEVTVTDEE